MVNYTYDTSRNNDGKHGSLQLTASEYVAALEAINHTNSKGNRMTIKCVTSYLIETENGLKVNVEGLLGNNFTEKQLHVVKLRIIDQFVKGTFFFCI